MKRLLVNGSPRGKKSNTRMIISWMAEGIAEAASDGIAADNIPVKDLARTGDIEEQINAFLEAEEIVFAMPLYTDAMPGIVKNFIDSLGGVPRNKLAGKRVAFVVQSGFPESIQSEALGAWLERLARRLEWIHTGTILKGGMEGTQMMPDKMTAKLRGNFRRAGFSLVRDGKFDPAVVACMAKPRKFGFMIYIVFALLKPFGVMNMYWDMMLRKNNAFDKRFDAPYGKAFGKK